MIGEKQETGVHHDAQRDEPQEALSFWWQFLAMMALSVFFPIVAKMISQALGTTGMREIMLLPVIIAVIMISPIAPSSLQQLGLIATIVAVGGILTMLTLLIVSPHLPSVWGTLLATVMACSVGSAVICLFYVRLGVRYRLPEEEFRK
ncbi:MAG: hypothetical protein ACR2PM_04785 [Hyphomicrobiales bacterium]